MYEAGLGSDLAPQNVSFYSICKEKDKLQTSFQLQFLGMNFLFFSVCPFVFFHWLMGIEIMLQLFQSLHLLDTWQDYTAWSPWGCLYFTMCNELCTEVTFVTRRLQQVWRIPESIFPLPKGLARLQRKFTTFLSVLQRPIWEMKCHFKLLRYSVFLLPVAYQDNLTYPVWYGSANCCSNWFLPYSHMIFIYKKYFSEHLLCASFKHGIGGRKDLWPNCCFWRY
jgi:hypothetical protein